MLLFCSYIYRDNYPTPSFLYFLPSPFLTFCATLPTSFGGKGPHLRRWLVAQLLHRLRFSGVFLSYKANARRSVHSPQDHFIINLIISDRRDWRNTRGMWSLARNPDRSWWHRHACVKLFGRSFWLYEKKKVTFINGAWYKWIKICDLRNLFLRLCYVDTFVSKSRSTRSPGSNNFSIIILAFMSHRRLDWKPNFRIKFTSMHANIKNPKI